MEHSMFDIPLIVLAHGALGIWDEVIFLSIAAVFLVFMGISWVRSRTMEPDFEDADSINDTPESSAGASSTSDRFELK